MAVVLKNYRERAQLSSVCDALLCKQAQCSLLCLQRASFHTGTVLPFLSLMHPFVYSGAILPLQFAAHPFVNRHSSHTSVCDAPLNKQVHLPLIFVMSS